MLEKRTTPVRPTRQRPRLSPRTEVLAYRIWGWARDCGWDCTMLDVAEALGEPLQRVNRAAVLKGWQGRFRAGARALNHANRFERPRVLAGGFTAIERRTLDRMGLAHVD